MLKGSGLRVGLIYIRDPQNRISISILTGYPYLIGLHYKGVYMGYPYPNFCLCAALGPYIYVGSGFRDQEGSGGTGAIGARCRYFFFTSGITGLGSLRWV